MENCIFCRVIAHLASAKIIYEDEQAVAFQDINPQAPVHFLVVPRKHLASLKDMTPEDESLVGHLFTVAALLAHERQIDVKGFRSVINNGSFAGQSVFHLHLHVLGGRVFHWPPG